MPSSSPLLNALERATRILAAPPEGGITTRTTTPPTVEGTVVYLDEIITQFAQVQSWLRAHPDLLIILDRGIHDEVRRMERRVTLANILTNLAFTCLGTILGLYLPLLLTVLTTH